MFKKLTTWHAGLSKARRVLLWVAIGFFGIAGIGSFGEPTKPSSTEIIQTTNASESKKEEVKQVTETTAIPFEKVTKEDGGMNKGATKLETTGVAGVKTITYNVTYIGGTETKRVVANESVTTAPITEVTLIGTYVAPPPAQAPARAASNCDPNYSPCVPNVSYDLDCPDIGFSVRVIGNDVHRFDRDNDGAGCESY